MSQHQLDGIEYLLELHGSIVYLDNGQSGYWWKIDTWKVPETDAIPHGIKYRLTLHNEYGTRLMGYDNAHVVKAKCRSKIAGVKRSYDHKHSSPTDKGVPYEFESPVKLLEDFFNAIDETIAIIEGEK
jgi:hypothetical protein